MLNEFMGGPTDGAPARQTPDPAWRLLGHACTGYDWHGGYGFGTGRMRGTQGIALFRRVRDWWRARRQARELRQLTEHDREDAGLAVTTPATRRRSPFGLTTDAAAGARAHTPEAPGGPCLPRPC